VTILAFSVKRIRLCHLIRLLTEVFNSSLTTKYKYFYTDTTHE